VQGLEIIIRLGNELASFAKSPLTPPFQREAISPFGREPLMRLSTERSKGMHKRCCDDYKNISFAVIGDRKEL